MTPQLCTEPKRMPRNAGVRPQTDRMIQCGALRPLRWLETGSVVAALLVLLAVPALAHAELISSTPRNGETLKAPPNQVALHFSEALEPKFSHFFVTVPSGTRTEARANVQGKDATLDLSSVIPQGSSAVGSYTVDGQVLSVDGHQSGFRLEFTVQNATDGKGGTPDATGGGGEKQSPGSSSPTAPAAPRGQSGPSGAWIGAIVIATAIAAAVAMAMRRRRS